MREVGLRWRVRYEWPFKKAHSIRPYRNTLRHIFTVFTHEILVPSYPSNECLDEAAHRHSLSRASAVRKHEVRKEIKAQTKIWTSSPSGYIIMVVKHARIQKFCQGGAENFFK